MGTCAMLPTPIVPEIAVQSAWKWLTSPAPLPSSSLPEISLSDMARPQMLTKRKRRVKKSAATISPDDDQLDFAPWDRNREEDDTGKRIGQRAHGAVDGAVD